VAQVVRVFFPTLPVRQCNEAAVAVLDRLMCNPVVLAVLVVVETVALQTHPEPQQLNLPAVAVAVLELTNQQILQEEQAALVS
jgi:hypothetical protein